MAADLSKNEDLQRLFLLELLVDSVKFDYKKIDLDKSMIELLKQTCVRFNFLNFPVIEVCEEDFCQTQENYKSTNIVFKNGKSCFFSLSGLPLNTECLKLGATIIRQKDEPPPVVIGTTCIQLDKSFVNVLNNYNHITETGEACKSLKDVFPIFDDKGIMIGTITLFIRLSCFGKAIITHFKIPQENEKGYLFKNTNEPKQLMSVDEVNSAPVPVTPLTGTTPVTSAAPVSSTSTASKQQTPTLNSNATATRRVSRVSKGSSKKGTPIKGSKQTANNPVVTSVSASGDASRSTLKDSPAGKTEMLNIGTPGNISGGTPGTFPESIPGTISGDTPGTSPWGTPVPFIRATPGTFPEATPGASPWATPGASPWATPGASPWATPGASSWATPGASPWATPGASPWATPGASPWATPGMFPEGKPGAFLGGTSGILTGGEPGMDQSRGLPGMLPTFTVPLNQGEFFPELGMGEQIGKAPYSSGNFLSSVKNNINNQINKNYKELTVSINGHEFNINVLRKSRKKREKNPEFHLCGRIPTVESSESDESVEEELNTRIETEPRLKNEDERNKEIPTTQVKSPNQVIETKPTTMSIPQPQPNVVHPKPQSIPFSLCECDIPLPKGFHVPDTPLPENPPPVTEPPPTTPPTTAVTPPQTPHVDSPPPTASSPVSTVSQAATPPISTVSVIPLKKKKKDKKIRKAKESPQTYCLTPNCPMGFPWPPDVPQQKKIVKVPCCSQVPMIPGSLGVKEDQVIFQMANGLMPNFASDYHKQRNNNESQSNSPYILKLGATNLPKSKCTKMILELPVPKLNIKKVITNDHDTQYLESDIPVPEKIEGKPDEGKKGKDNKKGKKGKKGKAAKKGEKR